MGAAVADFIVQNPAGRLVVARWTVLRDVERAEAFRAAIGATLSDRHHSIICADWRASAILSPKASEVVRGMLSGNNPRLLRSAILLPTAHATFNLQTERLVREAGNPLRRTFRDPEALLAWLGELLTPEEAKAARTFLG